MITLLSLTLSSSARERTLRIMSLWSRARRAIKKERRGEGMEYRSYGGEVKGKWANSLFHIHFTDGEIEGEGFPALF